MQTERRFTGREFAPAGRLELQRQTKHIAIKFHGTIHIGHKLDYVGEFHCRGPPAAESIDLAEENSNYVAAVEARIWQRLPRTYRTRPARFPGAFINGSNQEEIGMVPEEGVEPTRGVIPGRF